MSSLNYPRGNASTFALDYNLEVQDDYESIYHMYGEKMTKLSEIHSKMDMIYNYRLKEGIKDEKEEGKKEEKVRKTRKDKEGRKFICGKCKLGYLSYPALYTHIKTKHQGIAPEDTIRGESGKPKKRGRPKVRKTPQIYERELERTEFPKELTNLIPKDSLDVTEGYEFDLQSEDPVEISTKYFVGLLREIKKMTGPKLKIFPINKVMTTFLQNIKEIVDAPTLATFEETFMELVNFVDKNCGRLLKEYQETQGYYVDRLSENESVESYCAVTNPQFLPVLVSEHLKIIESDDDMPQVFLMDFCQWLHDNQLTDIKLIKNSNTVE